MGEQILVKIPARALDPRLIRRVPRADGLNETRLNRAKLTDILCAIGGSERVDDVIERRVIEAVARLEPAGVGRPQGGRLPVSASSRIDQLLADTKRPGPYVGGRERLAANDFTPENVRYRIGKNRPHAVRGEHPCQTEE